MDPDILNEHVSESRSECSAGIHCFGNCICIFRKNTLTHSWAWALLEKLPIVQPFKNFPAFYGTRRFITTFTRALHWSLSSAS
jgi:hypothetical protein